jgi:Ca-activated chloride channel family protein
VRRRRTRRYRRLALRELHALHAQWQLDGDDGAFAAAVNRLLKRTALAAFPRADVAALAGADWLAFLDGRLREPRFTDPDLRALATLYQPRPEPVAAAPLHAAAERWIRSHRC